MEVIPPTFSQFPELDKAMNIANQANFSPEEEEKLRKQEMFLEDQRGSIIKAKQEGLQEGLEQGIRWIFRFIERQFESIPPEISQQIQNLSVDQLERLSDNIFEFNNLEELSNGLQENG